MRVAIFVHGGIAGGHHQQGFPALEKLVVGLSNKVDITVFSFNTASTHLRPYPIVSPPRWLRPSFARYAWLALRFLLLNLRSRFHILHGFWALPGGKVAATLGKRFNIPWAITFMGGESAHLPQVPYGNLIDSKQRERILELYQHADALVLLSEHANKQLVKHGAKRPTPPDFIQFGMDMSHFVFNPGSREAPYRLIHIANLTPVKDQLTLLEGVAEFMKTHQAQLQIIGGDYYQGACQSKVKSLGIQDHVSFLGELPYDEVATHLQAADILVHTSLHEGQGLIFSEAMACGTLVLSTPVGIADELAGTATMVTPFQNPKAFASQLVELVENKDTQEKMLSAGKSWVASHTETLSVEAYHSLYQRIARQKAER